MKHWNQRLIDWYRSSKSDIRFLIWIVFLKNCTSASQFYSSINIHLFEKWSTCWEAGKTPGTECKYPEPGIYISKQGEKNIFYLIGTTQTELSMLGSGLTIWSHLVLTNGDRRVHALVPLTQGCGWPVLLGCRGMLGLSWSPWPPPMDRAGHRCGGVGHHQGVLNRSAEISFNICKKVFDTVSSSEVPRTWILTRKEPVIIGDVSTIILWIYSMTRTSLFPRQQNSNPVHDCSKGGLLSFCSFEETHNLMGKMPEIIRQNSTINPNGSKISAVRISHQKSWKSNQSLDKIFSVEYMSQKKEKSGWERTI